MTIAGLVLLLISLKCGKLLWGKKVALQREPLYQHTHGISPSVAVAIMLAGDECSGAMVAEKWVQE